MGMGRRLPWPPELGGFSGLHGLFRLSTGWREGVVYLGVYADQRCGVGNDYYPRQRAGTPSGDCRLRHDRRGGVFDVYPGETSAAVVCTRHLYGRLRHLCRAGGLAAGGPFAGLRAGVWLRDEKQRPVAGGAQRQDAKRHGVKQIKKARPRSRLFNALSVRILAAMTSRGISPEHRFSLRSCFAGPTGRDRYRR